MLLSCRLSCLIIRQWATDSCGTAAYHVGEPPDHRGLATMKKHGLHTSHLGRKVLTYFLLSRNLNFFPCQMMALICISTIHIAKWRRLWEIWLHHGYGWRQSSVGVLRRNIQSSCTGTVYVILPPLAVISRLELPLDLRLRSVCSVTTTHRARESLKIHTV